MGHLCVRRACQGKLWWTLAAILTCNCSLLQGRQRAERGKRESERKQEREAHRVDFCVRHKRKTMKHRCKGLLALFCIPGHMPLARPALRFVAKKSPTKCKFKHNESGCWSVCSMQTVMFMRETRETTST